MSKPFFVRPLTRAERKAIQKLRKHPPSVAVYRRAQAVHFSSQGLKVHQIAEIVGRSRISVTRWLHQFNQQSLAALWPGKSTGRPPKADADFQAALIDAIERNPKDLGYAFTRWTVQLLAEHLYQKLHIAVSYSTIYKLLKRLGYRYGMPKLSLKHRQDEKDVKRAKRQKIAALKKQKIAAESLPFCISTRRNSTSIRVFAAAGTGVASE